ncbi:hypothetical protein DYB25_002444 [Aphanomyces astaci]|uniref:DIX domain-containing protein n=1 Tax=Aphanomyces astaci TaxID=112090 RepID=A0A397BRD2_APHAT|nr:hypothetical protein DYB25_002444 [Aphanomyces astaci]RHY50045.1 hypothetical protein DYB34_002584 [Aphanomyces astaci]RHZ07998.1 hypothetical protein DYB26_010466 [Aphanomyces astaci]
MFNYFIPDDGDTPDHLNIFPIPSQHKNSLRLSHIKKVRDQFVDTLMATTTSVRGHVWYVATPATSTTPVPHHFAPLTHCSLVWLDVDDDDPVPDFNGLIISKISRISDSEVPSPSANTSPAPNKSASSVLPRVSTSPAAVPDLIQTNVATRT